jgi:hypothetical protein
MKIFKLIFIPAIFIANFAYCQTGSIDVSDFAHSGGKIKGKDLILTDRSLDKYVGTWIWTDGKKSLKISFVKETHHYGKNNKVLDLDILRGSYELSENGKIILNSSSKEFSGYSAGKTDTLNVFVDFLSRQTQVALFIIYLNSTSIRLELDSNRFEYKNDKNYEFKKPIILTKKI